MGQLTKKPDAAPPAPITRRAGTLDGAEASDLILPSLHLFQDVGNECEQYGKHDKGTWVDALTQEGIKSPTVVPVYGYKEYLIWEKDGDRLVKILDRYDSRDEIPSTYTAEDGRVEVWDTITWMVMVYGGADDPSMPHVLRFKKSSLRAAKTLNTFETARANGGKGVGLYKLGSKERSNDKGRWFEPVFTPAGDPSSDQVVLADAMFDMVASARKSKTLKVQGEDPAPQPRGTCHVNLDALHDDDIPI